MFRIYSSVRLPEACGALNMPVGGTAIAPSLPIWSQPGAMAVEGESRVVLLDAPGHDIGQELAGGIPVVVDREVSLSEACLVRQLFHVY